MLKRLTQFERETEPLASAGQFVNRFVFNVAMALGLIALSLLAGMSGYRYFEGMNLADAYLNASMILSGMGPVGTLQTTSGKIFAGTYALYCGVLLIVSTGIILAPVVHRVLHEFHADDDDRIPAKPPRRRKA